MRGERGVIVEGGCHPERKKNTESGEANTIFAMHRNVNEIVDEYYFLSGNSFYFDMKLEV